jgi:hypothetical protein
MVASSGYVLAFFEQLGARPFVAPSELSRGELIRAAVSEGQMFPLCSAR